MLENVIRELFKVRGIEHPFKYYGEYKYSKIQYFYRVAGIETRLSSLRRIAGILDVPPNFIVQILKYGVLDDEYIT